MLEARGGVLVKPPIVAEDRYAPWALDTALAGLWRAKTPFCCAE
jgi:hypothetical protein